MSEKKKRSRERRGKVRRRSEIISLDKDGDVVEGEFRGFTRIKFGNGIILSDGIKNTIIPEKSTLTGLLSEKDIGKTVMIECFGKIKSDKGQEYYDYEVYLDPEEVL